MPKLGYVQEEGRVLKWYKKEGERVEKGEILVEVESEKIVKELEAPLSGTLYRIFAHEGETLIAHDTLAIIVEPDEKCSDISDVIKRINDVTQARKEKTSTAAGRVKNEVTEDLQTTRHTRAFPAARRLAEKHCIDLAQIPPKSGIVSVEDVRNFIEQNEAKRHIPMTGFRETLAKRMTFSARTYAPVTTTWEVDVTDLVEMRKKLSCAWKEQGVRVTITAFLIKAVAHALKEIPLLNSTLKEREILLNDNCNIGVAVSVERSGEEDRLVVPVIHDADKRSLTELARSLEELIQKARQNKLSSVELSGGTFTITNVGAGTGNVVMFTPLINPPESAILGVGTIIEKPVVRSGNICVRATVSLCLTYDHRIILPTDSAKFRRILSELLENPGRLI